MDGVRPETLNPAAQYGAHLPGAPTMRLGDQFAPDSFYAAAKVR